MAPNHSTVANVARRGSKPPASPVPAVSSPTSALPAEPAVQRTQDTFDQVRKPKPPIDPSVSNSPAPPSRLPPGLTNNNPHVRPGVAVVAQRIDGAAEGVQGMTSFACGLFGVWPLVKLVKLLGGSRTEGEEDPSQGQVKLVENNAEDDVDGLQGLQERDAMGNKAPPPYPQIWTHDLDDKEVQKHLNDHPV